MFDVVKDPSGDTGRRVIRITLLPQLNRVRAKMALKVMFRIDHSLGASEDLLAG